MLNVAGSSDNGFLKAVTVEAAKAVPATLLLVVLEAAPVDTANPLLPDTVDQPSTLNPPALLAPATSELPAKPVLPALTDPTEKTELTVVTERTAKMPNFSQPNQPKSASSAHLAHPDPLVPSDPADLLAPRDLPESPHVTEHLANLACKDNPDHKEDPAVKVHEVLLVPLADSSPSPAQQAHPVHLVQKVPKANLVQQAKTVNPSTDLQVFPETPANLAWKVVLAHLVLLAQLAKLETKVPANTAQNPVLHQDTKPVGSPLAQLHHLCVLLLVVCPSSKLGSKHLKTFVNF